jgi:acetyltransferase
MLTPAVEVAQAIIRVRESVGSAKPLLATLIGDPEGEQSIDLLETAGIPTFRFPEDAVVALSALTWYSRMRSTPLGTKVSFPDTDKPAAEAILDKGLEGMERGQRRWLSAMDSFSLLRSYGITCVPTRHAADAAEAARMAREVGFPVVLKLSSTTIVHKTDVRGVYLDLEDESAVTAAFRELSGRLEQQGRRDEMDGVLIQPMAKQGLEAVLGVHFDEQFGPVMMAGLGGIYLELFQDVQFSLHPLTDLDARNMISRLKSSRLFQGYRGGPALDVAALEQTVLRLSQMVDQHPQILDVDLNPVLVLPKGSGCMVLDVRFQIAPADMYTEFIIRQLDD